MKAVLIAAAAALVTGTAFADRPQDSNGDERRARSTIVVTLNGLACATSAGSGAFNARSWSWGVTNTAAVGSTGSGGGAGRPLPGDVTIKKAFDACSSALLRSVARGSVSASASVVQRDGSGNVIASLELRDVLITGWNVGGQARDSSPDESLTLAFREVCLSGSGSARVCYDVRDNRVT